MPVLTPLTEQSKEQTPFDRLNDEFRKSNNICDELIARLRQKLHKLSDTNVPTEAGINKSQTPELPFREGQLMFYYDQNSRFAYLLTCLSDEVNKIENLI